MNNKNRRPVVKAYEEISNETIAILLNRGKCRAGMLPHLRQLESSRNEFLPNAKVSVHKLKSPLVVPCEKFIADIIAMKWKLTDTFMCDVHYMGSSTDETSHHLYYKALFSQPTETYPIPQATVTVYFRVENKHLEPPEVKGVPLMTFRIEGQDSDHDVRYVLLTADWILAVMKMKIKLSERIEAHNLF